MKRWQIAGLVALLAVVLLAYGAVRYFTGGEYIGKRLSTAIASADGVNRVRIGSSSFNPLRGSFVATDLEYLPDELLVAQRKQAGTPSRARYSATASSLRVEGIRLWPLLRGRIVADSATVDGARLDAYLDRTAGPAPPPKPATLPHVSFQAIGRPVRIDTVRVTNTEIVYSEKAKDGSRPGKIKFTDLSATFQNLTNDPTRMTSASPCTIDLRARIAGAGQLEATLGYDLLSPRLSLTYKGTVGRMKAEPLNEMLVPLDGMRITKGVIDSTWFDFKVSEDVARGKMKVLYRDVDFEVLDKVTLERDLGTRLQTFVAGTKMSHANPADDGEPARVVTVLRERAPESSLFGFMWKTLKEGIKLTLGG